MNITDTWKTMCIQEAQCSGMPGVYDGAADAYRHILISALLTSKVGETIARYEMTNNEKTDH